LPRWKAGPTPELGSRSCAACYDPSTTPALQLKGEFIANYPFRLDPCGREEVARRREWLTSTLFRIETGQNRLQPVSRACGQTSAMAISGSIVTDEGESPHTCATCSSP
jgi:hypothetical protein